MEANQLPELKPCPMCGFSNTEVIKGKIDYQAHCPACLMHGPDRSTEIYAIESWNSIPRRSELVELLWRVHNVLDDPSTIELRHLGEYINKLRKGKQ